jgi:cytoplasmic iron level regulating protein YaaA (DUF328/UPF0246 family)
VASVSGPGPGRSAPWLRGPVGEASAVLILLPPSETKASGGDGRPLDLEELSHPALNGVREILLGAITALAADVPASIAALELGPRQLEEVVRNATILSSPTMPAIRRYTGVLFDALDQPGLRAAERRRSVERLAVASALFGLLRASDPIPAYRLSGGSQLPGLPPLPALWRPVLGPVLAGVIASEPVVDLRSGAYAALAPVPGAIVVRVLSERADGSRAVVSHANKAAKGLLARELARTSREPSSIEDVARLARRTGFAVERSGERRLDLIVR